MLQDMDRWYQVIISGSVVVARLSAIITKFRIILSIIRPAPKRIHEVTFLLDQLSNVLQSFLKLLTLTEPPHDDVRQATSMLEIITEQMHVFEKTLLYHEEATQNLADNLIKNPISGMVRFKLFGRDDTCDLQGTIQRLKRHVMVGCAYLDASIRRRGVQSRSTTQAKAISHLSPAELEDSSRSPPFTPCDIVTQVPAINSLGSGHVVAELEGSPVPLWASRSDTILPAPSDHKQEFVPVRPSHGFNLTRRTPEWDRSDPRPASIKSCSDLCTMTCRLEQKRNRNTFGSLICDSQKSSSSIGYISPLADFSFSIGPMGWIDPVSSYCNTISERFTCNLCRCHSDSRYENYRACVESSSRYHWYLQFCFGKILIDLTIPVKIFKAACVVPTADVEAPYVVVYLFADCLVLAHYPAPLRSSFLERPDHSDKLPTHVQPFARIHFSSIAYLDLVEEKRISLTTKLTADYEVISVSLVLGNVDDHKLLAWTIMFWLQFER